MNHNKNTPQRIILSLILLIIVSVTVNATILANAEIDKNNLSTNEIGALRIKFHNDSDTQADKLYIRITSESGLVFIDNGEQKTTILKTIDSLKARETKEVLQGIKVISVDKPIQSIYIYYGFTQPLKTALATSVNTTPLPITVNATMNKSITNNNPTMIINFKLTNDSNLALLKASVEVLAPTGFTVVTPPIVMDKLDSKASIEKTFEVVAPIDASGEQVITIAYGFFDAKGPHYFEKQFKETLRKTNYDLILLLGFIVLIVALYLFLKHDKPQQMIKGTAEKK
jgi:hypothetical protein